MRRASSTVSRATVTALVCFLMIGVIGAELADAQTRRGGRRVVSRDGTIAVTGDLVPVSDSTGWGRVEAEDLGDSPLINIEARVFALQLALFEAGAFTWPEWTARLGAEIARNDAVDDAEGSAYYRYWLRALEGLMADKNIAPGSLLPGTAAAWRKAAERTPHGEPIDLRPEDFA